MQQQGRLTFQPKYIFCFLFQGIKSLVQKFMRPKDFRGRGRLYPIIYSMLYLLCVTAWHSPDKINSTERLLHLEDFT